MDWEDLRYLLAISRSGTLTGAAKLLAVARTTVGRRLEAAEDTLGVLLFHRTADGLVPTPAGEELVETAQEVEERVLEAEGRVLGRDAQLRGGLRVTTVDFVYRAFSDVFTSFIARYPGIELTIIGDYEQASLRRREADVALRLSGQPSEHLVGKKLGMMEGQIYAAKSLVERIGADAQLSAYPVIREDERKEDPGMSHWFALNAPGARIAMRYGSYEVLLEAVKAGVGIHLLPCWEGDAHPELVRVGPPQTEARRPLWVLTLPELARGARVRAFLDHLYTEMDGRLDMD